MAKTSLGIALAICVTTAAVGQEQLPLPNGAAPVHVLPMPNTSVESTGAMWCEPAGGGFRCVTDNFSGQGLSDANRNLVAKVEWWHDCLKSLKCWAWLRP